MNCCRYCKTELKCVFLDLGFSPISNAYLTSEDLHTAERHYPLKVYVCDKCFLVQTQDCSKEDELFTADYAYFSSTSTSWLEHSRQYFEVVRERLGLDSSSLVVEIASNDGYFLRNAVAAGIPCLGIEPTRSTAEAAERIGVPTIQKFFGTALARQLAAERNGADLIVGNNVFAHVPDINDFTAGMKVLLKPEGTIALEFPHLLRLIEGMQFDTIYHEHYSYLSLSVVRRIFETQGLRVYDVEELSTHGGSLRVYGCHAKMKRVESLAVQRILDLENRHGLNSLTGYLGFQHKVDELKNNFLRFLIDQKMKGKRIAAYGAAAKGNTLLNYAGVKPDLLPVVFDAAPSKQGKFLPGSHIPILAPSEIANSKPECILILPWNIREEVIRQLSYVREWGCAFAVAIPTVKEGL